MSQLDTEKFRMWCYGKGQHHVDLANKKTDEDAHDEEWNRGLRYEKAWGVVKQYLKEIKT